jgi:hypothetical protein
MTHLTTKKLRGMVFILNGQLKIGSSVIEEQEEKGCWGINSLCQAGCWWLTPVILATGKAEIRRIKVLGQPGQIVL